MAQRIGPLKSRLSLASTELSRMSILIGLILALTFVLYNCGNSNWLSIEEVATEFWYDANWSYRRKITIDRTNVENVENPSTTYADFPVLVYETGLSNINENGTDIRFTTSDMVTELPREIESYTAGTLYAWVKVTLTKDSSDSTNDVIYMYYGYAGVSEPAPISTYGSQNVWDTNFKMVQHLGENTTSGTTRTDSTSNGNTGTAEANVVHTATGGRIDGADNLNAAADYVDVPSDASIDVENITMSVWIRPTALPIDGGVDHIINRLIASRPATYGMVVEPSGDLRLKGIVRLDGSETTTRNVLSNSALSNNNWYYAVTTYDGDKLKLYVDGVKQTDEDDTDGAIDTDDPGILRLGEHPSSPGNDIVGFIDEVRISSIARTAEWILTSYNNQCEVGTSPNCNSAFLSFGTEFPLP